MKKTTRQAQRKHYQGRYSLHQYVAQHRQAWRLSWQRFRKMPGMSLLTVAVITIVLSLPLFAWVGLKNITQLTHAWSQQMQLSLFLQAKTSGDDARALVRQLQMRPDIATAQYISPADGLRELAQQPGLESVMSQLSSNPLPGVIVVQPVTDIVTVMAAEQFLRELQQLPGVELAQNDYQWLQRFYGLLAIARHVMLGLTSILILSVIFVVNHSVRMVINHYRQEITVMKLVGATTRFIARPFLYLGLLYGLVGALGAWLVTSCVLIGLTHSVQRLADLYQSDFVLHGIGIVSGSLVTLGIAVLGFCAAWLAVRRQYAVSVGATYF